MRHAHAVTHQIAIDVEPRFLREHSSADDGQWLFAYHITISNQSAEEVTLISREWVITNGHGRVEHVRGPGVVGVQPRLAPGQAFRYTSGCPLDTAVGSMAGTYHMRSATGREFAVDIPEFALFDPDCVN